MKRGTLNGLLINFIQLMLIHITSCYSFDWNMFSYLVKQIPKLICLLSRCLIFKIFLNIFLIFNDFRSFFNKQVDLFEKSLVFWDEFNFLVFLHNLIWNSYLLDLHVFCLLRILLIIFIFLFKVNCCLLKVWLFFLHVH
jgi:hypothetical protein